jgi:UDP-N-acetylmuramoyl-tripeptide--D-alanyl-D-alanine ligase
VVVTSITEEHLEGLGDLEGVLREEMGGVTGVPVVITPASQPEVSEAAARSGAGRVVAAGLDAGDVHPDSWTVGPDGIGTLRLGALELRPPVRGAHNLRNTMLALAVARECGVSLEDAAHGISGMPVPPMRTNFQQLGALTVINDAYNANPGSVRAALELLQHAGAGRQRVAVLGSMLELGGHAGRLHAEILDEVLASPVELLAATGDFAKAAQARLAGAASDPAFAGRVVHAEDAESIWPRLQPLLAPDALVLLKGSRGVRLERILPRLAGFAGVELAGDAAAH